jgi:hypothetical protein
MRELDMALRKEGSEGRLTEATEMSEGEREREMYSYPDGRSDQRTGLDNTSFPMSSCTVR